MATNPSPQGLLSYLTNNLKYNPQQAAAIVGNIEQESGFNPSSFNKNEGAFGLLQWRGPRLDALKQFAAANGSDPADWQTQLNFAKYEMGGPEAKSAAPFLASNSVPQANDALRGYIRYGDNSQGTRLNNALHFAGGLGPGYAAVNSPPLEPGTQAPPLPPPINIGGQPQTPQTPLMAAAPQQQQPQQPSMLQALASYGMQPQQQQQMMPPQFAQNPVEAMALTMPKPNTQGLQQLLQNSPALRGLIV